MTLFTLSIAVAVLAAAAWAFSARRQQGAASAPGRASPADDLERRRNQLRALLPAARRAQPGWTSNDLPLLQDIADRHLLVEQHGALSFDEEGQVQVTPTFKVMQMDLAYALGEVLGDLLIHELPAFRWRRAAEEEALPFNAAQNPVFLGHEQLTLQVPIYAAVVRKLLKREPVQLRDMLDGTAWQLRALLADKGAELMPRQKGAA